MGLIMPNRTENARRADQSRRLGHARANPDPRENRPNERARKTPNRKVVALVYDGLCTFEFGIAVEAFGLPRPEMGPDWYSFAVASADPSPLRATGGVRIVVDGGLDLLEDAGTIVLPGWKSLTAPPPPEIVSALRRAHERGARLISICSGVFALAGAGLLDGKRATTHWKYADQLTAAYPAVTVERDVLYVDEGPILTSAGSAAGVDLCLYVIRKDFGVKAANMVARRLVVAPHRDGGQAQFVEQPVPRFDEGARLSPLLEKVAARLSDRHAISDLAEAAGMSERTFTRRFRATTGMAPGRWILEARVRRAQELLETTRSPVSAVAESCGFSDAGALRRHFLARVGVTPVAYRARFGARPAE